MPLSRWFGGGRLGLRDRVVKGLQQARDGDADGAIETIAERFSEALAELRSLPRPVDPAWLRLAARLAYRAGDMPAAADFAQQALEREQDAPTWNLLGRLRIWLNRNDSVTAFRRAADLQPNAFVIPYRVKRERFTRLAEVALAAIPETFQAQLANTMIVVDDLPDLEAVREGEDPDLLGLYEGATVLEHGLPERIVLYQRNHENIVADERELAEEVRETMRHEVGHHFGMEEDELPY
ncbi:MAG TPA: metallopeptidase family protein [Candidatus Dormibacteraeota bacterium]|nr:metallopeptidase family protein [Candidatus Dormibacteraeota bacterium]